MTSSTSPRTRLFGGARWYWRMPIILVASLSLTGPAYGQLQVFEGGLENWQAAVDSEVLVDFDDVTGTLAGTEYAGLPGTPTFSLIEGFGLFTGDFLADLDLPPVSPPNVFTTNVGPPTEGIVRIHFEAPVRAIGAWFIDVESGFAQTGFSTDPDSDGPQVAFSVPGGDDSQVFLGFVSDAPFTSVDIYFTRLQTGADGSAIDDLRFELAPPSVPSVSLAGALTLALALLGGGALLAKA